MGLGSKSIGGKSWRNNNSYFTNLNMSFWNINGYKSSIFGNKFTDPDFVEEIQKSDFVGMGETHIHDGILEELVIPGFVLLKNRKGLKCLRSPKSYGGIAVFVKPETQNLFHPVETENQDIIWVKIDKQDLGLDSDIYIGTIYINPYRGKLAEYDRIEKLREDIM